MATLPPGVSPETASPQASRPATESMEAILRPQTLELGTAPPGTSSWTRQPLGTPNPTAVPPEAVTPAPSTTPRVLVTTSLSTETLSPRGRGGASTPIVINDGDSDDDVVSRPRPKRKRVDGEGAPGVTSAKAVKAEAVDSIQEEVVAESSVASMPDATGMDGETGPVDEEDDDAFYIRTAIGDTWLFRDRQYFGMSPSLATATMIDNKLLRARLDPGAVHDDFLIGKFKLAFALIRRDIATGAARRAMMLSSIQELSMVAEGAIQMDIKEFCKRSQEPTYEDWKRLPLKQTDDFSAIVCVLKNPGKKPLIHVTSATEPRLGLTRRIKYHQTDKGSPVFKRAEPGAEFHWFTLACVENSWASMDVVNRTYARFIIYMVEAAFVYLFSTRIDASTNQCLWRNRTNWAGLNKNIRLGHGHALDAAFTKTQTNHRCKKPSLDR